MLQLCKTRLPSPRRRVRLSGPMDMADRRVRLRSLSTVLLWVESRFLSVEVSTSGWRWYFMWHLEFDQGLGMVAYVRH